MNARTTFRSANPRWRRAAIARRILMFILVATQTAIAGAYMMQILPYHGRTPVELAVLVTFIGLFAWISIGFWTAIAGFFVLLGNARKYAITHICKVRGAASAPLAPTAILMPIYNENPHHVFAGLKATYVSLQDTGQLSHFEFFILSDTTDAARAVDEELAWAEFCRSLDAFDHVHYRRRRANIKRKSGNIGDFCRRWGAYFRYMIVLDADSIMAGQTLKTMVQMMEVRPEAGIIQTPPVTVNRTSLFARIQQFANRVYGPMFTAGVNFWRLGECYYWGHNAIIRVRPFMEHCALARLPGRGPMAGEILSHDFVEAALMRRAGWEVWVAYDLGGSYEETPPTLLDELKRDRRWCQGNLQHLRLLGTKGLSSSHRTMFVNGVMAYASAMFWLLFLILSTVEVAVQALSAYKYFPSNPSLFPVWPEWHPDWALMLIFSTAVLLFAPKILSLLLAIIKKPSTRYFGGTRALTVSVVLESIVASLLAPIRMVFHAQFVLTTLMGLRVRWGGQVRDDAETDWLTAVRSHGTVTVIALGWAALVHWLNPAFFWWLTPITGALIAAIPLSVYLSRASLGQRARRWRLFTIPEEIAPPPELVTANNALASPRPSTDPFIRAVVHPQVNAIHIAMLRRKPAPLSTNKRLETLKHKALRRGPSHLTGDEKAHLLQDAASMQILHLQVWQTTDRELSQSWGLS